jgi:hypothetical protein
MTCQAGDCKREAVTAIKSATPASKEGLVNTLYQFPEDAPKSAQHYCIRCAANIMVGLVRLADRDAPRLAVVEVLT